MSLENGAPRRNSLGQPIGPALPDWTPPPAPPRQAIEGRWCRLEPLEPEQHAADLHAAYAGSQGERVWTYSSYGPFDSLGSYREWMDGFCAGSDPQFFAIRRKQGKPVFVGKLSYLRITPEFGSIEVGHICFSPQLQRTTAATEAIYLIMRQAFDLGYRRFEWKCDSLNDDSQRAAVRLGFRFEGTFRQATVYKKRSRDTMWYSVIDTEWPVLRRRFESWLDPANFDAAGRQRVRIRDIP